MDRLLSMSVFAKAVELGSFSAAGDVLRMSSQLVGKHVQTLEQHLGVRLINRTTRRHHLTEAGFAFYERVKIILAEVEAAEGMAAISGGTPRGRLRINTPVSFGIHALSKRLPEYMAAYPEVSVDMSLSNRLVDLVDEGFDVAFRVGELSDSGLIARALAPYRLRLCAAPSYLASHPPITHPNDLAQHECLGFSYTELRTRWTFEGPEGEMTVPVSGRLMVDSGEALLMAARAGMGVLIQPCELVRDDLAAGRLVEVLPEYPVPSRPFHILYAPDRRMTPKLRSFIDFAVSAFGIDAQARLNC
ncbi:DNA-binding transcriptional regulator, LysR family [Formivibrio citricus]|uniref:DNA-binding transcriptional regulator, LysR family n=1 Tax=Formivibrio citricus TaxID=83765 RepID=A0A1I5B307_9NEIS|nr:LysR family transcriptional regulator [Formivibrio citricus]SFN69077.1 DNA-binding transcriptional regulator, LysR family [Formivibrio citricus]